MISLEVVPVRALLANSFFSSHIIGTSEAPWTQVQTRQTSPLNIGVTEATVLANSGTLTQLAISSQTRNAVLLMIDIKIIIATCTNKLIATSLAT